MPSLFERFQKGWNAFRNNQNEIYYPNAPNGGSSIRPDYARSIYGGDQSIVNSIINRISMDVAALSFRHIRANEEGLYKETIPSGLNFCLSVEANKDQTGRELIQHICHDCCKYGVIAVVPTAASANPFYTDSYDIRSLRVARIVEWFPDDVRVRVYNDKTGHTDELVYPKRIVAIIQNPLHAVMNEPNSDLQRLKNRLRLMDKIDEEASSNKLDLIIQLPYVIKSEARKQQAEKRRKDIEMQLSGSRYGIAYTDGTEKIVQLNRSLENNLLQTVQYLTTRTYNQLGLTEDVFNNTANDNVMQNYYARTIEPIASTIALEFRRKWLTKTALTQGQDIRFYKEPFKLMSIQMISSTVVPLITNAVVSKNEVRSGLGYKAVDDPRGDQLVNENLSQPANAQEPINVNDPGYAEEAEDVDDAYMQ